MQLFSPNQERPASDVLASSTRYTCRPIPTALLHGDTWREMGSKRVAVEPEPKTVVMTPEELAEVLSC
jgi:hypothetical protein